MNKEINKIEISSEKYTVLDSIINLNIEDSFIHRSNKLNDHSGSGESRKYIGSYKNKGITAFFEYEGWGFTKRDNKRYYPIIQKGNCFFSKTNILRYLLKARSEYFNPKQAYKKDISNDYLDHVKAIENISHEIIPFSIVDVSDFFDSKNSRAYIRSNDDIWNVVRKVILPKISYLTILKVRRSDDISSPVAYYFRLILEE